MPMTGGCTASYFLQGDGGHGADVWEAANAVELHGGHISLPTRCEISHMDGLRLHSALLCASPGSALTAAKGRLQAAGCGARLHACTLARSPWASALLGDCQAHPNRHEMNEIASSCGWWFMPLGTGTPLCCRFASSFKVDKVRFKTKEVYAGSYVVRNSPCGLLCGSACCTTYRSSASASTACR